MSTQKDRVLAHLKTGAILSRLDGWSLLGVLELPARICELRQEGWAIETEMYSVTNRFGERVRVARWYLRDIKKAPVNEESTGGFPTLTSGEVRP